MANEIIDEINNGSITDHVGNIAFNNRYKCNLSNRTKKINESINEKD